MYKRQHLTGAGISPVKKDFIGPVKPMVDKDKDGISDFVDSDAGSGKSNKTNEGSTKKVKTIKTNSFH